MHQESKPQREELSSNPTKRTANQGRRVMITAAFAAPAIIASSAQTAYAQNGGTKVSPGPSVNQQQP